MGRGAARGLYPRSCSSAARAAGGPPAAVRPPVRWGAVGGGFSPPRPGRVLGVPPALAPGGPTRARGVLVLPSPARPAVCWGPQAGSWVRLTLPWSRPGAGRESRRPWRHPAPPSGAERGSGCRVPVTPSPPPASTAPHGGSSAAVEPEWELTQNDGRAPAWPPLPPPGLLGFPPVRGTLRVGHRGWHRCLGLAGQWPKKQCPHLWPRFAGIAWLPASLSHAWDCGSLVSDLVPWFSALNATEISGDLNSWTYISLSVPGVWLKSGRYGGDCGFEGSVQVKSLPAERMKTVQQKLQCCCLGRVAKRTSHLTLSVKPSQEQALSV